MTHTEYICNDCDAICSTHVHEDGFWDEAWGYRAWIVERVLVSDCCNADVSINTQLEEAA